VYFPDAIEIGREKKRVCAAAGAEGLFPLDFELSLEESAKQDIAHRIFASNEEMMRRSDCAIANLTPFRGPCVDDGTAYEIGAMVARQKPIFGYANVTGDVRERIAEFFGGPSDIDPETGRLRDPQHCFVEDFGLPVNLMLACAIERSGGKIFLHAADKDRLGSDLTAFAQCVEAAIALLKRAPEDRSTLALRPQQEAAIKRQKPGRREQP
jgi:nucleoside 2-deoxyribosyltransferase